MDWWLECVPYYLQRHPKSDLILAWVSSGNGDAFKTLTDPKNNIAFEMHQYLDSDGSVRNLKTIHLPADSLTLSILIDRVPLRLVSPRPSDRSAFKLQPNGSRQTTTRDSWEKLVVVLTMPASLLLRALSAISNRAVFGLVLSGGQRDPGGESTYQISFNLKALS
jgi:hypothetical protein